MNKEKLIVCDKCYHSNLDGGQFLGEVWCDNCESWNINLIEVPKSEVLKKRKKIEKGENKMKKYTDEEVMNELQDMGFELFDEDGNQIWSEIAINEGFEWQDDKGYWTYE